MTFIYNIRSVIHLYNKRFTNRPIHASKNTDSNLFLLLALNQIKYAFFTKK